MQRDGMCVQTKRADVLRVYADAGRGHVDAQADVLRVNADADGGRGRVDARADMLCVYADADGGRGRVDARVRCMCVRTRMTVKKEKKATERKKRKTYPVDADDEHWRWHADAFRADALACGHG